MEIDLSRHEKCYFIPDNYKELINNKKILLIGCGGVGSPLADLIIRGGFTNLTLVDLDEIDKTNLQRQIYYESDIGKNKAQALKSHLLKINKDVSISIIKEKINEFNIKEHFNSFDLIIDSTDNFKIRKLINNFALENNIPWLYTGAIRGESVVHLFTKNNFDKIFSLGTKDEKCSEHGVLGSTTHITAGLAFNELIRYFIGEKDFKLIKYNSWLQKLFVINV
jgi:adenylyltransferase/sulfurtransferase